MRRSISLRSTVYPACAGIDRYGGNAKLWLARLPRMRGDRPKHRYGPQSPWPFTPHARGSTDAGPRADSTPQVYPACAGIDRASKSRIILFLRLPRMRGDRPYEMSMDVRFDKFTPHARGSTVATSRIFRFSPVYPACAGIDLVVPRARLIPSGLPRMRGDRPTFSCLLVCASWFTPHARGSTRGGTRQAGDQKVYPACAGIDRGLC